MWCAQKNAIMCPDLHSISRCQYVDARKTSLTGVKKKHQKIASPLRGSWAMIRMLVDARKTPLTGVQNSNNKNRLAATRLVDDAPQRIWVTPPPPLAKSLIRPCVLEEYGKD